VDQVLTDPVVLGRHMVVETTHPLYGPARAPGNPMKVDGSRDGSATPAPIQGEHTEQVLRDLLGYGPERIAALKQEHVL
jgi:crotonobetainyl-CoA:carnitine CoA-transferase CaiB-like acyl-CoA transferase